MLMKLKASTRVLLVLLQLAIGWHFFYEGVWKSQNPSWSSKGYLKNAPGPLAMPLRTSAGDPDVVWQDGRLTEVDRTPNLIARLTPIDPTTGQRPDLSHVPSSQWHDYVPPPIREEWNGYFEQFTKHYLRDTEAKAKKEEVALVAALVGQMPDGSGADVFVRMAQVVEHEQRPGTTWQQRVMETTFINLQDAFVEWLEEGTRKVKRPNFGGPAAEMAVPIQERLKECLTKREEAQVLEQQEDGTFHVLGTPKSRKARDEAAAIRTELEGELDNRTDLMKKALRELLTYEQRRMADPPAPAVEQAKGWAMLPWIDGTVKWALLIIGACLLAGLFSRSACVAGAALLTLFYVSMPALPGLPDSPMTEGHYLLINKNLIELLALAMLATTRPGERYGLDVWIGAAWKKVFPAKKSAATKPTSGPPSTPNGSQTPNTAKTPPAPGYTPTTRS
jgi:uncharacterized membrane protein YphA (DoxX/SURF4 family)